MFQRNGVHGNISRALVRVPSLAQGRLLVEIQPAIENSVKILFLQYIYLQNVRSTRTKLNYNEYETLTIQNQLRLKIENNDNYLK